MKLVARGLLAFFLLAAAGCVPTSSIQPVQSLSDLSAGEVLLIGRVELDPPLGPSEQQIGAVYDEYRNSAILITDDELRDARMLSLGDMAERIDAKFNETFFVRRSGQPFWILQGWVVMKAEVEVIMPGESYDGGNAPLPGIFRVDVAPGDKAVYIGTIRYHRDDFFGIERIEVKDDFAAAKRDFHRKFQAELPIRKSLAVPIRQ